MLGTNKKINTQLNSDFHIFDKLPEEVIIYEITRNIQDVIVNLSVKYMNNAAITNKIVPEEVIGKSITELYNGDIASLHLKMTNKILKSSESSKYKVYFESLNKYYSVSAYSPDDNTYVTISTDITEYIKIKEELRQVNDNLEEIVGERTGKLKESNETLKKEIIERKQIEEALRKSEQKFRSMIEKANNGIMLCDEQGIIIEYNKAQEKIAGLKQEEVIGKCVWDILFLVNIEERKTPESYKNVKAAILGMLKTGKVPHDNHVREVEIQRHDGKRRFIEQLVFTIPTDKGFMACNLTQDITDRKKMEEDLRESEEKFREIFNNANDMISLAESRNGYPSKYVEVNKVGCERLGYTKDEFLNLTPSEIIAPEVRGEMGKNSVKIAKNGCAKFEIVHLSKNGERIPVEVNLHSFKLKGKDVKLAISRDIRERKKMEESLKESEEKFRETLQQSYDGIAIANELGIIIEWNPALERITGWEEKDMLGKFLWDMHYQISPEERRTPELVEKLKSILIPLLEGKMIIHGNQIVDREIQRSDGKYISMQSIDFPIKTEKGVMLASFNRDVTEYKKAEKQLKETVEELKRSNEELQRFAYVASHDLQEPLRAISSFTQLLERRYHDKLDSDADEFIGYVVEAAQRMQEMILDLLEYSRVMTKGEEFKEINTT